MSEGRPWIVREKENLPIMKRHVCILWKFFNHSSILNIFVFGWWIVQRATSSSNTKFLYIHEDAVKRIQLFLIIKQISSENQFLTHKTSKSSLLGDFTYLKAKKNHWPFFFYKMSTENSVVKDVYF